MPKIMLAMGINSKHANHPLRPKSWNLLTMLAKDTHIAGINIRSVYIARPSDISLDMLAGTNNNPIMKFVNQYWVRLILPLNEKTEANVD